MKAHKNWSIIAMVCMIMACFSGFNMKSKDAHKYWAMGALGCMLMAMFSGYRMVHKPKKKAKKEEQPVEDSPETPAESE